MLRKTRIGIAVILFTLTTFYFLDFADILPSEFHWLARLQVIPAVLSFSLIILIALSALTLVFGRIYCSTICPMGVWQDIIIRIRQSIGKKKKRYKFRPARNVLRWTIVAIVLVTTLLGFTTLLALVDPYSAYGRIAVQLFKPIYMLGNNLFEYVFSQFDNYTFYKVEITIVSLLSFLIALITFLSISILAGIKGRTFCNTICPVGTILGLLSRYSRFQVRINTSKCNSCGLCETRCKASCINSKEHTIDSSRCIDCFNCIGVCKQNALVFTTNVTDEATIVNDSSKRRFLLAGVAAAGTTTFLGKTQKTLAKVKGTTPYARKTSITPPGSISQERFNQQCTSCHLCVSKCPSHILKPAFMEYGLEGIMQPTINFDKGFCNFDCTVCGEVCPNHAITPLTIDQKHLTQMGYVVFIQENCIVYTDETSCGACSEHCPTQAISMIPFRNGLTIPHINTEICVGCGGCEYVCPARPFRAVHIEGNLVQQKAKPFKESEKHKVEIDDFGF